MNIKKLKTKSNLFHFVIDLISAPTTFYSQISQLPIFGLDYLISQLEL